MRLIDADALMKVYAPYEFMADMGDAMEILANFPTVDAEPVIRCKDCKKFVIEEDETYCEDMFGQCDENGFCAWAERKEKWHTQER